MPRGHQNGASLAPPQQRGHKVVLIDAVPQSGWLGTQDVRIRSILHSKGGDMGRGPQVPPLRPAPAQTGAIGRIPLCNANVNQSVWLLPNLPLKARAPIKPTSCSISDLSWFKKLQALTSRTAAELSCLLPPPPFDSSPVGFPLREQKQCL